MPAAIMRALWDRVPTAAAVRWGAVLPVVLALFTAVLAVASLDGNVEPERQPVELSDGPSASDGAEERVEPDLGAAALVSARAGGNAGPARFLDSAELDRRRPGFPLDILRPPRPSV